MIRLSPLPIPDTGQLVGRLWESVSVDLDPVWPADFLVVQQSFNDLPLQQRMIIAMRHFERLDTSEIAAVMNLSRAEANIRYWEALRSLWLGVRRKVAADHTLGVPLKS